VPASCCLEWSVGLTSGLCNVVCRGTFTTYMAGTAGAVVFCLHGGGYTGLTWSLVAQQLKQQ
jgi:hypothetical protein